MLVELQLRAREAGLQLVGLTAQLVGLPLVGLLRRLQLAEPRAEGLDLGAPGLELLEGRREPLALELRGARLPRRGLLELAELAAQGEELVLDPLELLEPLLELALLEAGRLGVRRRARAELLQLGLTVLEAGRDRLELDHPLADHLELSLTPGELDDHGLELGDAALEGLDLLPGLGPQGVVAIARGAQLGLDPREARDQGLELLEALPGVLEVGPRGAELLGQGLQLGDPLPELRLLGRRRGLEVRELGPQGLGLPLARGELPLEGHQLGHPSVEGADPLAELGLTVRGGGLQVGELGPQDLDLALAGGELALEGDELGDPVLELGDLLGGRLEERGALGADEVALDPRRLQLLGQRGQLVEAAGELGLGVGGLRSGGLPGLLARAMSGLEGLGRLGPEALDLLGVGAHEARPLGAGLVQFDARLLELGRERLQLDDLLLEARERRAGGLPILGVAALPLRDLPVALGDRGAEGAGVLGELGAGLLELGLEPGEPGLQPVPLLGDLAVHAGLPLRLRAGGRRLGRARVPGALQLLDRGVLRLDPFAQLLGVGSLRAQLRLERGDALHVGLVGPLDALHIDVVLVQGGDRRLPVRLGEAELAIPELLLDPVLGQALSLGEEPRDGAADDGAADDQRELVEDARAPGLDEPEDPGIVRAEQQLQVAQTHHDVRGGCGTPLFPLRPRS